VHSSSTSSSKQFPRAAVLAAALVVAGEIAVGSAMPVNQGRTNVDDLLADLDRPQTHAPIVLWADSVTAGPVRSVGGSPGVADLSTTQAISMAGVYFTYRRFVETAGAPKLFVLSLIPESYGNDLEQVFTPTYFESAFLRWDEIRDFAAETSRYGQSLRMAGNKVLHPPSMLRRAEVRRSLQRLRSGGAPFPPNAPLGRIEGLDPKVAADLETRARLAEFKPAEIASRYLERLAHDTAATSTRIVIVTPALARSAADGWTRTGYLAAYERWLREFAARHANVSVDPVLQFAEHADVDMYDTVHLKPAPGKLYAARFLARVKELE
jgi:hypothetical protein